MIYLEGKGKEALALMDPLCTLRYSATHVHKHHHIQVFHRDELRELNESVSHLPGCTCVTKYVDAWYIKVEPGGEEAGPGRLPG